MANDNKEADMPVRKKIVLAFAAIFGFLGMFSIAVYLLRLIGVDQAAANGGASVVGLMVVAYAMFPRKP